MTNSHVSDADNYPTGEDGLAYDHKPDEPRLWGWGVGKEGICELVITRTYAKR